MEKKLDQKPDQMRDPMRDYRKLTSCRLVADDPEGLKKLSVSLAAEYKGSCWQDLFSMEALHSSENSYRAGVEDILADYREEDFDPVDSENPPSLSSILSLACLGRSYVYRGGKQDIYRAVTLLDGLYRYSLSCLSKLDPIVNWSIQHYRGLAYDEIGQKELSVQYYAEVLDYINSLDSTDQDIANCGVTTLGNMMVSLFQLGRFDDVVHVFREHRPLRELAPSVWNDENNLVDAFRYVAFAYGHILPGSARRELLRAVTELSKDVFENDEKTGAIAGYNYAYLLYMQSLERQDETAKRKAREIFEKAYNLFEYDPFSIRSSAGKLSSLCLMEFMDDETHGAPIDRLLQDEGFTDELREQRRTEISVARAFLKRALNEHSIFFEGVENELNHHVEILTRARTITGENVFRVLRRWNSFTPAVPVHGRPKGKGGGYFLAWNNTGIVIDPGPDFMELFMQAGYSLEDIDAVVVTHAHFDHTCDLETILTLLHERNTEKRRDNQKSHSIDIYVSEGAAVKALSWLFAVKEQGQTIRDIHLVNVPPREGRTSQAYKIGDVTLQPVPAVHDDIVTKNTTFGLIMRIQSDADGIRTIGITSDTAWYKRLLEWYRDCDILVAHIGSISVKEILTNSLFRIGSAEYKKLVDDGFLNNRLAESFGFHDPSEPLLPGVTDRRSLERLEETLVKRTADASEEGKIRFGPEREDRIRLRKNHLGLTGITRLASAFNGIYFIVSEFGEELSVYRTEIARALKEILADSSKCTYLTGDAGLVVDLSTAAIRCAICQKAVPRDVIEEYCSLDRDREVVHVCRHCRSRDRELLKKRFRIADYDAETLYALLGRAGLAPD